VPNEVWQGGTSHTSFNLILFFLFKPLYKFTFIEHTVYVIVFINLILAKRKVLL